MTAVVIAKDWDEAASIVTTQGYRLISLDMVPAPESLWIPDTMRSFRAEVESLQ